MRIDHFKIEDWMNRYSYSAKYDLTSTCIEPLSIKDLLILCNIQNASEISDIKLDYGDIFGSNHLKRGIRSLYTKQEFENITVTHGAIGANQLVYQSLIEKGDDVVVIFPTYQQHYSVPKSLGANVKPVFLREENEWLPHLRELENSLTKRTKLICITNPNNPTGAVIPDEILERIVEIAKANNSWILSDEVYRGLNLNGNNYSKSVADIYEKGISVGSMSKTYSLAGLRVGWICGRGDLIAEANKHREYNTISVSVLDDYFASLALENREKIEARNLNIMNAGLNILKDWLNSEIFVKANLPQGATTALVRYKKDIPSKILCKELQKQTGVALIPGSVMEMEGFVRIGYCVNNETLKTGLNLFSQYLRTI